MVIYLSHKDTKMSHLKGEILCQKKEWKGIKSIGMEEKTIRKEGKEEKEYRYYISSLKKEIELFSRAVRGHWSIESMHWQLDVTFKEDANQTLVLSSKLNDAPFGRLFGADFRTLQMCQSL